MRAVVVFLGWTLAAAPLPLRAIDVVKLDTGQRVPGEVVVIVDDVLSFRPSGDGRLREVPMERVVWIDFARTPGEEDALEHGPSLEASDLRAVWVRVERHLERPRSAAGAVALVYADRLLADGDANWFSEALEVYSRVERDDWDAGRRAAGRVGRLRTLMATGRADEAVSEAEAIAEEEDDPALLIEARFILSMAAFDALRELEDEHPRWSEDPEVQPQRDALYHRTIDGFLFPFLFFGSFAHEAARGLMGAAEVYAFAGQHDRAREAARDILALYPRSRSAPDAEALLAHDTPEPEPEPPASPDP